MSYVYEAFSFDYIVFTGSTMKLFHGSGQIRILCLQ
jgi:hypothetical protein